MIQYFNIGPLFCLLWASDRQFVYSVQSGLKRQTLKLDHYAITEFNFLFSFSHPQNHFMLDSLTPLLKCKIHPAAVCVYK